MIDGKTFFDQLVRNNLRTYDSIQKKDYFKDYYKMIAIN